MKSHSLIFIAVVLASPLSKSMGEDAKKHKPDAEPILCRGHYHSDEDAIKQLARMGSCLELQIATPDTPERIISGNNHPAPRLTRRRSKNQIQGNQHTGLPPKHLRQL